MGYQLETPLTVSELADRLGLAWQGADSTIVAVATLDDCAAGCLVFSKSKCSPPALSVVIGPKEALGPDCEASLIVSGDPRLDFIRALAFLDAHGGFAAWQAPSIIDPTAQIGENVVIETGCVIGAHSVIEANAVIHKGTRIGKGCRIRAGANIGGDGFGFARDESGKLHRFCHLGGVVIGDEVEIGALSSVARGTLSDTIIHNGVKTDNLVHIAHNCVIGEQVLITACAEISGGVTVGKQAWIGPNASVLQKLTIGDNSFVGIGAVVTKDVEANGAVAGNPARKIKVG